jgi:hypothetical protein
MKLWQEVKVKVMLRPMASRPVSTDVRRSSGANNHMFITFRLRVCWYGVSSLTRERVHSLQIIFPRQRSHSWDRVLRGSAYILLSQIDQDVSQALDFLFVTSHDSQGYGRSIQPAFARSWQEQIVHSHYTSSISYNTEHTQNTAFNSSSIVGLFVASGTCLSSHCLPTDVSPGSTIQACWEGGHSDSKVIL